ncbi:tetratricopeptide repeat protein [Aquisediminimonas profunda]|uniref:tetratricopeptide repeat protein n=1 Tax=Aquisediminimonas profunda TaxID=1550733 RepID=UPI001C631C21|nr:tetratricopeptide repeat protein [Aquisediminimonas profunda]
MGLAALRLGRINAAKASLDEALQRCPDRWQSLNALGVLADRKGDWEAGRIAYAKALALAPDQPAVLNNVGFSLLLQRRFGEAEIFLTKAMSLAPADERISNNLDLAQAGQGKPITASNEAQAYRLNNAGYMAYLGGNLEAAKSYFNEAIKLSPSYFERAASNLEMAEGRQEK